MEGDGRKPKSSDSGSGAIVCGRLLAVITTHLSNIILNTRVPSEGQIQGNAEGSQEGSQGQHQDPRARCSSFPFLQALPILVGSVSRTSPKGQGGWDSCATPPHLKSLRRASPTVSAFPPPVPAPQAALWGGRRGGCLLSRGTGHTWHERGSASGAGGWSCGLLTSPP